MVKGNDGKAYIAGWIIKLLAGIFIAVAVAWAGNVSKVNHDQDVGIIKTQERVDGMKEQLNRIENKLDKLGK